jgi:hypothetical protein
MNGSNTYQERQSTVNHGEILFEKYCALKSYKYWRLGFDEKNGAISHFYRINPLVRNLPDYLVDVGDITYLVAVKGTTNFKQKEINMLPLFMEWFSSKDAPLVYAFCFANQSPKLVYPEKIIELYKVEEDKQWSDGVIYRTLKF